MYVITFFNTRTQKVERDTAETGDQCYDMVDILIEQFGAACILSVKREQ